MSWGRRLFGIGLLVAAVVWAAGVMRQVNASDDGGPAIGALCMALPSVFLLVAAGVVLSPRDRRG